MTFQYKYVPNIAWEKTGKKACQVLYDPHLLRLGD